MWLAIVVVVKDLCLLYSVFITIWRKKNHRGISMRWHVFQKRCFNMRCGTIGSLNIQKGVRLCYTSISIESFKKAKVLEGGGRGDLVSNDFLSAEV